MSTKAFIKISIFGLFISSATRCSDQTKPAGMIPIEGGSFEIGASGTHRHEGPATNVSVDDFYLDATEVTNHQFMEFVEETDYITTAESKDFDGSMVFEGNEWRFVKGASWRHPFGPESGIDTLTDHPVVHVSWEDANAYCQWKKHRLPTEAEWEYAAKKGLSGLPNENCNHWQGPFPETNLLNDRWFFTAPVRTFPPNTLGLYDMQGNVWEWCLDKYNEDIHELIRQKKMTTNPVWNSNAKDRLRPSDQDLRVLKGGSFLCSEGYCSGYRPEARISAKETESYSHIGFRCACN